MALHCGMDLHGRNVLCSLTDENDTVVAEHKYLAWALVQAAHKLIRYCPEARSFYDRKKAKKNGAVATKALACKLARCIYHMLETGEEFDVKKIFG